MHRQRTIAVVAALVVSAMVLTAAMLGLAAGPAAGQTKAHAVTTVTVTAGKPSEFKFTLSKKKIPAVGTVVFKVFNKGKIGHDFTINGKKTPLIAPGKSATLTVVFKKKGSFVYKCSVKGHASAGMIGSFGVAVTTVTPPPPPTTTTPQVACSSPTATTVQVEEFDFGFNLSQTTVPCGSVTFVQKNTGATAHNFHLQGVANAVGALIDPGKSTTMTVNLTPAKITYICDVSHHDELGMIGQLTVTG
jgi:uncharacterized cupredoxin-like copper-binding protein